MNSLACPNFTAAESHKSLLARSTLSTTLWASFSLSMFLYIVGISTGDKFSSLPKLSAAMTSSFLNRMNWLLSPSPIVKFRTRRNSLLSLLNTKFYNKWLGLIFGAKNRPNLSGHFPNSTWSVQVSLSKKAVALQAKGERESTLVAERAITLDNEFRRMIWKL